MLCARATLTAGARHRRYPKGTLVRAVIFAKVDSLDELQDESFLGLAKRGWRRMRWLSSAVAARCQAHGNHGN